MATLKQRVHRFNGTDYDTIHYETSSDMVLYTNNSQSTVSGALDDLYTNKAASSHNHAASNITSGTLAIARGGTNATSGAAAIYQLTNPATALASTGLASGDYLPVLDTSASTGKKVTLANLTAYLKATGEVGGINGYTEKTISPVISYQNINGYSVTFNTYTLTDVKLIYVGYIGSYKTYDWSAIWAYNGNSITVVHNKVANYHSTKCPSNVGNLYVFDFSTNNTLKHYVADDVYGKTAEVRLYFYG